ncbi:MAG: SDR family NAD(P)-dependent oxidoreductase, partial [Pseudomonadales bacterium]|nr:SDR family NAD(P)-dependent oxidoreductase [Pseudomonadales bacterium]
DDSANGYVRSEGGGLIVLKRLSQAQKDGDRIQAVIKGSAINQDGRSNGITAPNSPAQESVIRKALLKANIQSHNVGYVEAHGTGTALGDPIEIEALSKVYGLGPGRRNPLLVGSVKSNLGHLEAAAGVAGLVKSILSLQQEVIPQSLHVSKLNRYVPWDTNNIEVVKEMRIWPGKRGERHAGVSSFGFGGTNAHVVVSDQGYQYSKRKKSIGGETGVESIAAQLVCLSAKDDAGLTRVLRQYSEWLEHSNENIDVIAQAINLQRSHFSVRAAFVVTSKETLLEQIETFTQALDSTKVIGSTEKAVTLNTIKKTGLTLLSSLRKQATAHCKILINSAMAYVNGESVEWQKVLGYEKKPHLSLPFYPLARKRYWFDVSPEANATGIDHQRLPAKTLNFSEVEWAAVTSCGVQEVQKATKFIVFADNTSLTSRIIEASLQSGINPDLVYRGECFKSCSPGVTEVNPLNRTDFNQLLDDTPEDLPLHIFYVWPCSVALAPPGVSDTSSELQSLCVGLVNLVAVINKRANVHLSVVTSNSQPVVPDQSVQPAAAVFSGLCRVAAIEYPTLSLRVVDLDTLNNTDLSYGTQLVNESLNQAQASSSMVEVAYRTTQRYQQRLVRLDEATMNNFVPSMKARNGSVVITGGLGGLGLLTASSLVKQGFTRLVLVGRNSNVSNSTRESIVAMEDLGASVVIRACDVTDIHAVKALFADINEKAVPITGVFHCAGVLADAMWEEQSEASFTSVFDAKVKGAWNLHEVSRDLPVEYFVCYSSIAALVGSPGQANYAAANSYLSGLSHYRRHLGLPAQCIQWGPWKDVGMTEDSVVKGNLQRNPLVGMIDAEIGIGALYKVLATGGVAYSISLPGDGTFHKNDLIHMPALVQSFFEASVIDSCDLPIPDLVRQLAEQKTENRREFIAGYILQLLSAQLGDAGVPDDFDILQPLQNLGLDSLMAIELRNDLNGKTGLTLPVSLLFDYPSVSTLARYLNRKLSESEVVSVTTETTETTETSGSQTLSL